MENKDALQIKIDEAKANLSEETKNAINAVDWRSAVLGMREKKGYSFSQLSDLEIETELLLYGLLKPEDYPKELEARMKISKEDANELVNLLNETIFNKIRNELIKNSEKRTVPVISEKDIKKEEIEKKEIKLEKPDEKENKVLNQSGIEIVSEEKKEEKPEIQTEKREDVLLKIENPEPTVFKEELKTPSFLNQKLGNSFKIESVETKHTDTIAKHSPLGSTKTDPYRMPIEE